MKIATLQMIAFGPFTDWSIDLSHAGLHLVYGPNEAGKSAALRGLKALLFGIDERTSDNFLHGNARLRVAGTLQHSDGRMISVVRRKGRSKTLLAPDESALDERILLDFLGGVGSDSFSRMFGLDHAELSRGGRDIVSGKGDAGESLFAAALGGQSIHQILEPLEKEADNLFKPRASTRLLNMRLDEYQQARKAARESSLPGRDWEEHTRLLQEAAGRKIEISAEIHRAKADLGRLERLRNALPSLGQRKELLAQRAKMGDVLLLPQDFSKARGEVMANLDRARDADAKARKKLADLNAQIETLVVPTVLLDHSNTITKLHKSLGSHAKAMQDLPRLLGEAAQLEAEAAGILKIVRPGAVAEEPNALRISLAKRQSIRELGMRSEALSQSLHRSKKSVESFQAKIEKAHTILEKAQPPRDPNELRTLLKRVQRFGDLEAEISKSRDRLGVEMRQANIELQRLTLWQGTIESIEGLAIPGDETVSRFDSQFSKIEQELQSNEAKSAKARAKENEISGKITSLELTAAVPTETDLEQSRLKREDGWKLVRAAWLEGRQERGEVEAFAGAAPLDQAYEMSVRRADEIADRLRREADRVAKHAAWFSEREQIRQEIRKLADERSAASDALSRLNREWQDIWGPCGIDPLPPREMLSWIQKQRLLVQRAATIRGCRAEIESSEARIGEIRYEILAMFRRIGVPGSDSELTLTALVEIGQNFLEMIDAANLDRQKREANLRDLEAGLAEVQREAQDAEASLGIWKSKWAAAVKELGLTSEESPETANILLDKIQEFTEKGDNAAMLRKRIEGIQRDAKDFTREVREIAGRVAPELLEVLPEVTVADLSARLSRGRADEATLKQLLLQRQEQSQQLTEAAEAIQEAAARLKEMCVHANCRQPEDLEEIELRSTRARELDERLNTVSDQLLAYAAGGTVEDLIREAHAINPDELPGRIAGLRDQVQILESELSEVDQNIGREKTELARMDGSSRAAEAAEKAQSSLAQIRDGIERYIHLRLAAIILRSEIERYRARNQGPVLKRASEIFSTLTLRSFVGLKTIIDQNDRPVLVGARPSDEQIGVAGMSDGTCDQLYLSLRLASLEKHLESHEPIPFVIDDILVNFDDSRSQATLKVLAELSRRTQVIFFTHHQHLIGLAGDSLPSDVLTVHMLGS